MSIKHRLIKLEQRIDKGPTIEQINARIRQLLGIAYDADLSQCSDEELDEYINEFLRQYIIQETGKECRDWSSEHLLSEYRNLLMGMAT